MVPKHFTGEHLISVIILKVIVFVWMDIKESIIHHPSFMIVNL